MTKSVTLFINGFAVIALMSGAGMNVKAQILASPVESISKPPLSADYALYTRGNGRIALAQEAAAGSNLSLGVPIRPSSPIAIAPTRTYAPLSPLSLGITSNYSSLRDTDNRYYVTGGWIDWSADRIPSNDSDWRRLA